MRGVASGPSHATPGTSEETVGRVHDHSRQGKEEVDSFKIMHSASTVRRREVHTERAAHTHELQHRTSQTRRHVNTYIHSYRKTYIQKKQHSSHELGYLLSVQKCPDLEIDHEECFLRAFCTKKRCFFDGFGRKNWVPSPLPPSLTHKQGHDQAKSETLRLFSNRPVMIRNSTLKSHENLLIVPKIHHARQGIQDQSTCQQHFHSR